MNILQATILGTIQGLTEFLPISSSGHLAIAEHFFGIQNTNLIFIVLIHLATLLAVCLYFRKTIVKMRLYELFILGVGTIPAVIFALLFKKFVEHAFDSLLEVAIEYIITAIMLLYAQRKLVQTATKEEHVEVDLKKISPVQAFIIGIWQAVAILPAISRSGATVVGALALGIDRETAFTFSFLLSIPAILGASILEFSDFSALQALTSTDLINYTLAFGCSLIFGVISLQWFHQVVHKTKLQWFAYYCFALSALLFVLIFLGK